ncbi:MAG: hypothetical protein WC974_01170 [Thermoplasmata archaeon]
MPEIDSEQNRQIKNIQILAMVFLILSVVLDIVLNNNVMGYVGAIAGTAIGVVGIFSKNTGKLGLLKAYLFIISGSALLIATISTQQGEIMRYGEIPILVNPTLFVETILFGIFFICYVETAYASLKFSKLIEGAEVIKGFDVLPVLRRFSSSLLTSLAISAVICIAVLNSVFVIVMFLPEQLAKSIEMNSIFGMMVSMGIIFFVVAFVLAFMFRKDQAVQMRGDEEKK